MSYGIRVVVPKDDIKKEKIRFAYCNWTLPMSVRPYPNNCKTNNVKWHKQFESVTKTTTLEKLMTAPCDCVCIIDEFGNYESMKRDVKNLSHSLDCESHLINK